MHEELFFYNMLTKYFNFAKANIAPILLLSIIFSLSSIFWTTDTVYSLEEKQHVTIGFPLRFILLDYSQQDRFVSPEKLGLGREIPTSFSWLTFFLNIVTVQIIFTGILFLVYLYIPRANYFFRFFSVKYILLILFLVVLLAFASLFIHTGNGQPNYQGVGNPVVLPPSFSIPTPPSPSPTR